MTTNELPPKRNTAAPKFGWQCDRAKRPKIPSVVLTGCIQLWFKARKRRLGSLRPRLQLHPELINMNEARARMISRSFSRKTCFDKKQIWYSGGWRRPMHLILIHAAAAARATVRQIEAAAVHYLCCTGIISPCLSLSLTNTHTHTCKLCMSDYSRFCIPWRRGCVLFVNYRSGY